MLPEALLTANNAEMLDNAMLHGTPSGVISKDTVTRDDLEWFRWVQVGLGPLRYALAFPF